VLGAGAQILATALMLATMNDRSFVVTIAYIKTEAIQAAIFGLIFLGDALTPGILAAILIATAGVVAVSLKGKAVLEGGLRPVLLGLFSGAMFAISAVGYRGAILSLGLPSFVMAATFTVAVGLVMQAAVLTLYLAVRDSGVLTAIVRAWRPSLFAGFMGAVASEFWFLAFALTSVANVRTLALVEVLFAQAISLFAFKQATGRRDAFGIILIVVGCALLIWVQEK
ncbi:MAG: DMT family transporter, partial [Rhizobiales bacterium]|nr:DMT family transporter [Hyphomicrobiales bacterium]